MDETVTIAPIQSCIPSTARVTKENLLDFLQCVDSDFTPTLSEKVELLEWSTKVLSRASYIACVNQHQLVGLLVFYCNNLDTRCAYISLLGVRADYRGRGYAREMLQQTIKSVREQAFNKIGVHSNNLRAITLYQSLGFKTIGDAVDGRYYMELTL